MPIPRKVTTLSEAEPPTAVKVTGSIKPNKPFPFAKKTTFFYTGGVKKKAPRDPLRVQQKRSSAGYDGGVTRKRTKSKKK